MHANAWLSTCSIKGHGQMLACAIICVIAHFLAQKSAYFVKDMRIELRHSNFNQLRFWNPELARECSDRFRYLRSKFDYALISEYVLICDMHLITRKYGILQQSSLRHPSPWKHATNSLVAEVRAWHISNKIVITGRV